MSIPFKFQIICSGIIVGLILLQTIIIAPTVFKVLKPSQTRDLLRGVFPKFFLIISIIGFISVFISFLFGIYHKIQTIVNVLTIVLSLSCFFLIPATNNAKDVGNDKLFSLLHKISVYSTMVILLVNLFWICLV